MSDHKIVGSCSTLLAKSNKKYIFRDHGLVHIKKMLYLCSDFKSSLSSGSLSDERKKIPYYKLENIRQFLTRISPKISMNPDPGTEYSVSLGITPLDMIPYGLGNLCYLMPMYYGAAPLKGIMQQGAGFMDILPWLGGLLLFIVLLFVINTLSLKKYRKL